MVDISVLNFNVIFKLTLIRRFWSITVIISRLPHKIMLSFEVLENLPNIAFIHVNKINK